MPPCIRDSHSRYPDVEYITLQGVHLASSATREIEPIGKFLPKRSTRSRDDQRTFLEYRDDYQFERGLRSIWTWQTLEADSADFKALAA
ncbi:MAG: hypothetical protein DMF84_10255 [Acidobacteria bacterium]|nr:MAG: hypothetical protein DMF84_10255 [Acidobacteriota bacterium]